jgi:hypothetical protein
MRRTLDLRLEIRTRAAEAVQLLGEYIASDAHYGSGVHRDPRLLLIELDAQLIELRAATQEACDAAESRDC